MKEETLRFLAGVNWVQASMRVAKTSRLGKKEVLGHVRDVDQRFLVKHVLEVLDASQVQCGG